MQTFLDGRGGSGKVLANSHLDVLARRSDEREYDRLLQIANSGTICIVPGANLSGHNRLPLPVERLKSWGAPGLPSEETVATLLAFVVVKGADPGTCPLSISNRDVKTNIGHVGDDRPFSFAADTFEFRSTPFGPKD